jgi:L-alanine-DL-glutamate epimerase-like enolase superfamily enzyme
MPVATLDATPVSVPYRHREVSSQIARDGVTDVVIRVETDDGCVGWGEARSGADAGSIVAAIEAMRPFVLGSDPWNREAVQHELYLHGLWQFRAGTANFAWAGIDMALADVAARGAGLPLYRLLGGLRRREVSYFFYLSRGGDDELAAQCADGLAAGFDTFYLKVGVDPVADLRMVAAVRRALGPGPRLRLDANAAWSVPEATRILTRMAEHDIDFVEQPVREDPIDQLAELRARLPMAVCANEGLWSETDAYARITARQADVFCFSPYWVGSLGAFQRLSHVAELEGLQVCKHTHGELGIAAAACHHALLTLPNVVEGNQQTAHVMGGDVLADPLPIASGPVWGVPEGTGIGVVPDAQAVADAARRYELEGQFLPYQREHLAVWAR